MIDGKNMQVGEANKDGRTTEALRTSEALQSALFNSTNVARIVTDAQGVIHVFNLGAERMLGYSSAEVLNQMTPAELSDPQELSERAKAMSIEFGIPIANGFEALTFKASRGIEDIFELTYICKNGIRFPAMVFVTALRNSQNGIIGYLLNSADNTARQMAEQERKQADEAHRASEARYRALFEYAPDGILISDSEGYCIDVNGSMCGMLGYAHAELKGLHESNLVVEGENAGFGRTLTEIKATSNYHREWQFRRKDGSMFDADVIATTMPDGNLMAMVRDVTARKVSDRALQLKNIEVEAASRTKSEFLANMSHELRTPLNSIIGFSEVLRDGLLGEMTEKQSGFVGDIFSSGKHLLSLINDVLDLSKVEAGKMVLDLEPVAISSLLANGLSIVREKAASHRILLDLEVSAELESIQADARKIKQIVYNLISNAVKFTADGGHVALRAERVSRAEVGQMTGTWAGRSLPLTDSRFLEFLRLSVTDNGIGISAEGLELLFKPFSQVDGGLARKFEGTGLGLAMVKLLAELHDGTVGVESAPGEGCRFTVWLPIRAPENETQSRDKPNTASRAQTIPGSPIALVVEDNYSSVELIRVHLEAEGFKILQAASAEAALKLAMQQPVSLITLDILLPNMDGWEFLSHLKQMPDLRRTPVVIMSMVADHKKAFLLGAAAILQKPVSRQELYESLIDLGLFPLSQGKALKVLVVDDDSKAVELIALSILSPASEVLRAYGGREAIEIARRELPDVIVLDLIMPEVNGFDVVEALNEQPGTARIPIVVVTAKQITASERAKLSRQVTAIMEKADFVPSHLVAEVRRAMSGREAAA